MVIAESSDELKSPLNYKYIKKMDLKDGYPTVRRSNEGLVTDTGLSSRDQLSVAEIDP